LFPNNISPLKITNTKAAFGGGDDDACWVRKSNFRQDWVMENAPHVGLRRLNIPKITPKDEIRKRKKKEPFCVKVHGWYSDVLMFERNSQLS
jgi:hypothetical protein